MVWFPHMQHLDANIVNVNVFARIARETFQTLNTVLIVKPQSYEN